MSEAVFRAAARMKAAVPSDKLDKLREKAIEARDLTKEIDDLGALISEKSRRLNDIYQKELPDLMDEAGTDHIGIPADGNMPAYDAKMSPYYSANIAASWSEDRKQTAFKLLEEEFKAGDLIKTDVSIGFAKDQRKAANKFIAEIEKKGFEPNVKEGVNGKTLTAWLKDLVENRGIMPSKTQLEALGASVGRVVKLKERKE